MWALPTADSILTVAGSTVVGLSVSAGASIDWSRTILTAVAASVGMVTLPVPKACCMREDSSSSRCSWCCKCNCMSDPGSEVFIAEELVAELVVVDVGVGELYWIFRSSWTGTCRKSSTVPVGVPITTHSATVARAPNHILGSVHNWSIL